MNAARTVREAMGLNRALLLCGVSKQAWCYSPSQKRVAGPASAGDDPEDRPRKAHIRHAAYGRPSIQRTEPSGQPQGGTAHIQEAGLERARAHQAEDNPGQQEAPEAKCPEPVLGV